MKKVYVSADQLSVELRALWSAPQLTTSLVEKERQGRMHIMK